MTEQEWLACGDPERLLRFLGARVSDRKARVFTSLSCSHALRDLPYQELRLAAEAGLKEGDGLATEEERVAASAAIGHGFGEGLEALWQFAHAVEWAWAPVPLCGESASQVVSGIQNALSEAIAGSPGDELIFQSNLIRELFPFRPVGLDPAWLTSTITALAQAMYETRDFSAMPILADALQDAGCTSDDILDHCRNPGPHARGCWVVDLILGKE